MIDGVPLDRIGVGSGWAIVAFVVIAIFRGWLIPKATHDREVAQLEREIGRREHDGNEWRTEGRIKDQQLLEKDVQLNLLQEVGRNVLSIMSSIQRNARSGDRQSGQEDS